MNFQENVSQIPLKRVGEKWEAENSYQEDVKRWDDIFQGLTWCYYILEKKPVLLFTPKEY